MKRNALFALLTLAFLWSWSAAKGPEILPENYLRGYDPVTILFSDPIGPEAGGPLDSPGEFLRVNPEVKGEFRFVDARTIQFRPADPWPPLARYRWEVGKNTRILHTMMVPPEKLIPSAGTKNLEEFREVTLHFRDPLALEGLGAMVSFEVRPLPGIEKKDAFWLTDADFQVKALQRGSSEEPARYLVTLNTPVGAGHAITLHLRLSLDDESRSSFVQYTFFTRGEFRIVKAGVGRTNYPIPRGGASYTKEQAINVPGGDRRIAIEFNAEPSPVDMSVISEMVRFSPAVKKFSFRQDGRRIILSAAVEEETIYKVILAPTPLITDESGRTLLAEGTSSFHFYVPKPSPYIRWNQSKGILERYGPQELPVSSRGFGRIDLRIYKIDPLDRRFWPFPSQPLVVDEDNRPPGPGEEPPEPDELRGRLSAGVLEKHIQLLGAPLVSRVVDLPSYGTQQAHRYGIPLRDHFEEISGPDQPGTYLVGYRRLNKETTRTYARVQVTDLCLTTVKRADQILFAVTSLKTGMPVSGAMVCVEGYECGGSTLVILRKGTTDRSGEVVLRRKIGNCGHYSKCSVVRVYIRKGDDAVVIDPSDPPPIFADNYWYGPRGGWLQKFCGDCTTALTPLEVWSAHLITERPIYRPSEKVHIKGYVRGEHYGKIKRVSPHGYTLHIVAPGGRTWKQPIRLTEAGTFQHEFAADDIPTGEYRVHLRSISRSSGIRWKGGSTSFRMENYRVPTFEVRLHGDDIVAMDDPFTVTLTASYYAGGRVGDEQVNWRATQFPYAYCPKGLKGYLWSSTRRYSRAEGFSSEPVVQKTDRTDQLGTSRLVIDPTLEVDGGARRYVVEGTVIGADEQTVTATKSVIALPAFSLGLQVQRYIRGEKIIRPKILILGVDEKPLEGKEVTVRLFSREWHSHLQEADLFEGRAKYVTDEVDTEIWTTTLMSGPGPDSLEIPVDRAGVYIIKLEARDKLGRAQVVSADLYVAGEEELAWEKPRGMVFQCVADKERYDPGDTARILLKSPFQHAKVLAVVEHPKRNEYHWLTVRGGKAEFSTVLFKEHIPKLPVHFLLMRGRGEWRETEEKRHDLTNPTSLGSTVWLPVTSKENQIVVTLDHPTRALPRDTVEVIIRLATPDGTPLPGEVTLWLVDQAVLALGEEKPLDPLPTFLPKARSNIRIADTRNRAVGLVPVVEEPGGGGAARERAPELLDKVTVRKKIVPVPYYNPRILVSEDGIATVSVELPDNVTNFKIRAVACSGPSRFGIAKSMLAVRLPMVVQGALPRFVRPGDSFRAGGIGRVVEGAGGPGWCKIEVDGLSVEGETVRKINWAPGRAEKLFFPIKVEVPDWDEVEGKNVEVTLSILRDSDGAGDALKLQLPVKKDRRRVRFEKLAAVATGDEVPFPELEEAPRDGTVFQSIVMTSEEAVLYMAAALDYLMRYPHGCTEQVVSQAYPLVAMKDLLEPLSMRSAMPAVATRFEDAIRYLKRTQKSSGLYSYWPGSSHTYVYLTAYVVEFLVEARQAGFEFPDRLLTRAVAALQRALRSDYSGFVSGWRYVERADALYALSRANHFEESYGIELLRKNQYMDAYGRARVAMALVFADRTGLAVNLEQPLWDEVVLRLRSGREVFSGLQEQKRGYSWGGVINSSEIRSTAWLLRALAKLNPTEQRLDLLVRGLVDMGDRFGWGNTWNNASCMITLAEFLGREDNRPEDLVFETKFASARHELVLPKGKIAASDSFDAETNGAITLISGTPDTSVVARMTLSYVPRAPGDSVAAGVKGFVVSRELSLVPEGKAPQSRTWIDSPGQPLEYGIGDVIEEHIRVVNPEERHFVAIMAPFAAGFEPLNPELAISGPEATPSKPNTIEPSYSMFEDDQAGFYFETMPKGTHDFYFRLRATFEGSFVHPAAWAEMMYKETTRGNSPGSRMMIVQREE